MNLDIIVAGLSKRKGFDIGLTAASVGDLEASLLRHDESGRVRFGKWVPAPRSM